MTSGDLEAVEVDLKNAQDDLDDFETFDQADVIMPVCGHWRLDYEGGSTVLNPGDTASVPENMPHRLAPAMSGACAARPTPTEAIWKRGALRSSGKPSPPFRASWQYSATVEVVRRDIARLSQGVV